MMTLFSASNYAGKSLNLGAVAVLHAGKAGRSPSWSRTRRARSRGRRWTFATSSSSRRWCSSGKVPRPHAMGGDGAHAAILEKGACHATEGILPHAAIFGKGACHDTEGIAPRCHIRKGRASQRPGRSRMGGRCRALLPSSRPHQFLLQYVSFTISA